MLANSTLPQKVIMSLASIFTIYMLYNTYSFFYIFFNKNLFAMMLAYFVRLVKYDLTHKCHLRTTLEREFDTIIYHFVSLRVWIFRKDPLSASLNIRSSINC